MTNILNEHPDFHVDLGDTFMIDGATSAERRQQRLPEPTAEPSYFGKIGPSVPIFLASGNHEDEEGWNLDDTPFSIATGEHPGPQGVLPHARPTDGFYSGNTDPLAAIDEATYGDRIREDYYAWTWGDALFVVIDEFQYTMNLPYAPARRRGERRPADGRPVELDAGAAAVRLAQADPRRTATPSTSSSSPTTCSAGSRGPIVGAGAGLRARRGRGRRLLRVGRQERRRHGRASPPSSAAGTRPIHQLFVENGVSAYFHGHDHQYCLREARDGIVYQEVPSGGSMSRLRWDLRRGRSRRLRHHQRR